MQPNQFPQTPGQDWQPQPQAPQQPPQPRYQDPYAALTPPSDLSSYPPQDSYQPPQPTYTQPPAYPEQPQYASQPQQQYPTQTYPPQQPIGTPTFPMTTQVRSQEPPYAHYDDPAPRGQRPPSEFELRFRQHVQSTIAEQPKRTVKVWPIVLGLLLLLILGGGGAAAYFVIKNQQPTAEERFQYAIAAQLQTPYINQDYDIHLDAGSATADFKIKSSMDVTNPASPKISGNYILTSNNKTLHSDLDFVTAGKEKAYVSFNDVDAFSANGIKSKTWYSFDPSDATLSLAIDPFGMISNIGTARGEFPVGKFSEQQQATILRQISSANPYNITNVTDEGDSLRYAITINSENFKKLDTVVAKLIGDDPESGSSDASQKDTQLQILIDKKTNRISKADIKKDTSTIKITITCPPQYEGTPPKDSLDLMKTLQANTTGTDVQPRPAAQ